MIRHQALKNPSDDNPMVVVNTPNGSVTMDESSPTGCKP